MTIHATALRRAFFLPTVVALLSHTLAKVSAYNYTFALIPKNTNSEFFNLSRDGCIFQASKMESITCLYIGPKELDLSGETQAQYINDLIDEGGVDGMSISVVNATSLQQPIARAVDAGIAVITFDSDAPDSQRAAYVGTDNQKFGQRLALVLNQVNPLRGEYAVVTSTSPNLVQRTDSFRKSVAKLQRTPWTELNGGSSTIYFEGNDTETLQAMIDLAEKYPYPQLGAIVPMQGAPMMAAGWMDFVDANRNMSFVSADMREHQLTLLRRKYCDALVGQEPFEMGELSMTTLLDLVYEGTVVADEIFGTALVEVVRVPLNLKPVNIEMHYIGKLNVLGWTLLGILVILIIGLSTWTVMHRKDRVVKASQPPFLLLINAGAFIFSSAIIPIGIDDQHFSNEAASVACMSMFWLTSMGFTLVFSALFAKTWRVNKIFHNPERFRRVKVTAKDVMLPLVGLLVANAIVMTCWEIIAPLQFVRLAHPGTDPWNRIISTYGTCRETTNSKGGAWIYMLFLVFIDVGSLVLANIQAYRARDIRTEFSESKYIALTMLGMLQLAMVGIPVLILVADNPRAHYVLLVMIIFMSTLALLVLMFVPKIIAHRRWQKKQEEREKEKAAHAAGIRAQTALTANMGTNNADNGEQGLKLGYKRPEEMNVDDTPSARPSAGGLRVVRMVRDSMLHITRPEAMAPPESLNDIASGDELGLGEARLKEKGS